MLSSTDHGTPDGFRFQYLVVAGITSWHRFTHDYYEESSYGTEVPTLTTSTRRGVTARQMDAHLEAVYRSADPTIGLFGPESMVWRIGREAVILVADRLAPVGASLRAHAMANTRRYLTISEDDSSEP